MEDLRYPLGRFEHTGPVSQSRLAQWIDDIEALPDRLRAAVEGLSDEQLETPYRAGGWTIRQVVHHLTDSHLNSLLRFKWALTEDYPTIKPYHEDRMAELPDYGLLSVSSSLDFLEQLHARWVTLLRALTPEQMARSFHHPDDGPIELAWNVGNYAWHGRHHLAHIQSLVDRQGWSASSAIGNSEMEPEP